MARARASIVEIKVAHEQDTIVLTPLMSRLGDKEFSSLIREYARLLGQGHGRDSGLNEGGVPWSETPRRGM